MNDEMFNELLSSVREGGEILQGKVQPSRRFIVDAQDIKQLRARFGLSQREFAALLGISPGTLRNWEQGRRTPEGPARVLLQVAANHPEALLDNLDPKEKPVPSRTAKAAKSVAVK
jgi:putative transcriptional regulator